MYRIDFYNIREGAQKTLRVHTFRAAQEVITTLQGNARMYDNVRMTYVQKSRIRELVILVQS